MNELKHRHWAWAAIGVGLCLATAAKGQEYPALKVEGGFENAQTHATTVRDATGPTPTVIIGGELLDLKGQTTPYRHPHKYRHFHFKLTNIAGRTVRFLYGPQRGAPPQVEVLLTPVVYYDAAHRQTELVENVTLEQISLGAPPKDLTPAEANKLTPEAYHAVTAKFTHRFRQDTAYVCQSFPFTNDDAKALADEAAKHSCAKVVEIGKSRLDKIPMYQVVITDPTVPDREKKGIWFFAAEDPWEFPGMTACAGAARWAMSDDPLAARFRRKFILSAIPVVQPDAVRRGWTNYSVDDAYGEFRNFSRTYDKADIPEHDALKTALRKWQADGRSVDYAESLHSSLHWGPMMRLDSGSTEEGKRFVDGLIRKTWMPWFSYQGVKKEYADLAERTGLAATVRELFPNALCYSSHTEQILMSVEDLPGFPKAPFPAWGKKPWTDEDSRSMRAQMIPHQWNEIEDFGTYRLLAFMELCGEKIDPQAVPPQLLCGAVDACASRAGDTRAFTVLYRDVLGREPKSVNLVLADGMAREMTKDRGTSPVHAIRFKLSLPIQTGKAYDFHFTATNGETEVHYPRTGEFLGPYAAHDK